MNTTNKQHRNGIFSGRIDITILLIPLAIILSLFLLFTALPEQSKNLLNNIRTFLGNDIGIYYMFLGFGFVILSLYIAFSQYGAIRLGNDPKPQYSTFKWGTMIFTSTMAADILFYSLCEWALYSSDGYIQKLGSIEKWAPAYSLFHWGPTAWSFYMVLAAAFGFMLHVQGRSKQKFSEACRPLLGSHVDGIIGKLIDLLAVIALLAGTATTFSLATPLLSLALANVLHLTPSVSLTIIILLIIALIYTMTVWFGMKGVSKLAAICTYLFFLLIVYVLLGGGQTRFIVESGFSSIGTLMQNFISLSTWMEPARSDSSFVQDWTIFYWAYWMAWCVATPFFIGQISRGRTIRQVILGGYGCGIAGTFLSFIVLGNFGLAQQISGKINIIEEISQTEDTAACIIHILETLPAPTFVLLLLLITMIAFYSTTFDALTMVISSYSYRYLHSEEEPDKRIRTFWAILFILLPIALIFSDNSMHNLQSISIIAAFPIGIIILLIAGSFLKDAGKYMKETSRSFPK